MKKRARKKADFVILSPFFGIGLLFGEFWVLNFRRNAILFSFYLSI